MGKLSFDNGKTFMNMEDMSFDDFIRMLKCMKKRQPEKIDGILDYSVDAITKTNEYAEYIMRFPNKNLFQDEATLKTFMYHAMLKYDHDIVLNDESGEKKDDSKKSGKKTSGKAKKTTLAKVEA